ncbi:FOG: WD40-like repeat protein [Mycobacteroides abscessus subsp. massiliense]|uniref:outer membrane protein assembly factor BamB family protein n=1 Tax=Mycobacteroides abscessus TaxID=36809 RepID=UPI0009A8D9C8|nr:PQQ-binding-like beta-propeller repeat protein [Mycobacteroides abscessus]SLH93689.1 FOG: WD40-like repeat protein [Mycobacteroides abscessus subsp. massiliense]SLI29323.1 FOG: WD40-like repeat protein [Mycobacteroides abscessus subsp. massiliense]
MLSRARVLASIALAALLTITGCSGDDSWINIKAAPGWSASYADAHNSSYTATEGVRELTLEWSRNTKGQIRSAAAIGIDNFIAVSADTPSGCTLMEWEDNRAARQRWCTRMITGSPWSGPLADGYNNLYMGQPGAVVSFPPTQWIRWRKPVIGAPTTPKIVEPGRLLIVTHLGQILIFDAQRGEVVGTPMDLLEGVDPADPRRGLEDCEPARPKCPISASPAYDPATGTIVTTLWQPDKPVPVLLGITYDADGKVTLKHKWASKIIDEGVIGSPVMSNDGETVYINDRKGSLHAMHTFDGSQKWSLPLGFNATTPPSVAPDGTIIAGTGDKATLVGIKDSGAKGEIAWRRDDLAPLSTSSQAAGNVGYAVVRDGDKGLALVVFNTPDGATINRYPLPDAAGFPVGISIGPDQRVIVTLSEGLVYGFRPET